MKIKRTDRYERKRVEIDPFVRGPYRFEAEIAVNKARSFGVEGWGEWQPAGIKWAGCRAMSPEGAEQFIRAMQKAVEIAHKLDKELEQG